MEVAARSRLGLVPLREDRQVVERVIRCLVRVGLGAGTHTRMGTFSAVESMASRSRLDFGPSFSWDMGTRESTVVMAGTIPSKGLEVTLLKSLSRRKRPIGPSHQNKRRITVPQKHFI